MASHQRLKYVLAPLEMLGKGFGASDVIVYSYMLNRFRFFQSIGGDFFENIGQIAKETHLSESTVKRSIKTLREQKHIIVEVQKVAKGVSNRYLVHDLYGIPRAGASKQEPVDDVPEWEG